ncbi:MAG: hypothetical protein R3F56_05710 [Planctomycetota bacterium]
MNGTLSTPLLTLLATAAALSAQRTWIVDAAGGPGVDFTDLPPAVAAAVDGDAIEVRRRGATAYQTAHVSKALRIVGVGSAVPLQGAPLTMHDVGVGKTCVVAGFDGPAGQVLITARNCAGTVVLRWLGGLASGVSLQIFDCAQVAIEESRLEGARSEALFIARSTIVCTGCSVVGLDTLTPTASAALGIQAVDTYLTLNQTVVAGGRNLATPSLSAAALRAFAGLSVATGRSWLAGGGPLACEVLPNYVSLLVQDPATLLTGSLGPGLTMVSAQVPSLTVTNNPPRTAAQYRGSAQDTVAVVAGLPHAPTPTPFGSVWFDPAGAVLLGVVVANTIGDATLPLPFATPPTSRPIVMQALVFRAGTALVSTPSVALL